MKTAIVTGASGNLGQAVTKKFIHSGYRVIGTVTAKTGAGEKSDPAFETVAVDLTDEKATTDFVNSVIAQYGVIDAAILTVGGFAMGKIADTTTKELQQQYQLNFETAYNAARPVFTQMLQQKNGRIFLVGSKPGLSARNGKGMVAYSLAKSLIFHLAELMNDEAKGTNVVTTVVVPSTIDTPQNRQSMPDADHSKWVAAEDIAAAIYFYTTDEAQTLREPVLKVYNNG